MKTLARSAGAVGAALLALVVLSCAPAEDARLSSVDEDSIVARDGDVYLASQPSLDDLDAWAERGVTTVVNLRSQAETADLSFDPAAEAAARGMSYVAIPMGGADGVSPDIRVRLSEVLADVEGSVALHCRSGIRAAHAYAAHLVVEGEMERSDVADKLGWPGGLSTDTLDSLFED